MDLAQYYAYMWEQAQPRLQANNLAFDAQLDSPLDTRRGLTLIARPPAALQAAVRTLLLELQALEPEQYYYPLTDLHVTILTPLSATPGFELHHVEVERYVAVLAATLAGCPAFGIEFCGLTMSAEAVLLQGFPQDDGLAQMRERVRSALVQSGLPQTLDQRYVRHTAHSTVLRFRAPLRRPAAFQEALERWRYRPLGAMPVPAVELVYNDWYHRRVAVQQLATFPLRPSPERSV